MEEVGRTHIGSDYDQSLGHGFFKAKEHDQILVSMGAIARRDSEVSLNYT